MMPWNIPRQQIRDRRSPGSASGCASNTNRQSKENTAPNNRQGSRMEPAEPKPAYAKPLASEVVAAVESLYEDKLKPFGRILLKRVRECNAAAATAAARAAGDDEAVIDVDSVPLIDPKCLRRICETCDQISVEPEDGKEYSALLVGREKSFVDVSSPVDVYPEKLWNDAKVYFESLEGPEMMLPGGRYACAQVLMQRNLKFLEGCSLGEVCHIVQLAVSQKRVLGYLEGNMVPFGKSVDYIKEQYAVWQQPVNFAKKAIPDMPLATWEQARMCLWEILNHASIHGQPGVITLSNVKRLFRSRFNLELSETALGHSRLNELLQDHRFSDICTLELQGKSQVVVQRICAPPLLSTAGRAPPAEYWNGPLTTTWPEAFATAAAAAAASVPLKKPNGGPTYATMMAHALDPHAKAFQPTTLPQLLPALEACPDVLSAYVQQLLELGDSMDALDALAAYAVPPALASAPCAAAARVTSNSQHNKVPFRSLSANCSTGDEGSVQGLPSEDGDSDGDLVAAASSAASTTKGPLSFPPGLTPPPGLDSSSAAASLYTF